MTQPLLTDMIRKACRALPFNADSYCEVAVCVHVYAESTRSLDRQEAIMQQVFANILIQLPVLSVCRGCLNSYCGLAFCVQASAESILVLTSRTQLLNKISNWHNGVKFNLQPLAIY